MKTKTGTIRSTVKYWEIISDRLSKAGWTVSCVSAVDCNGRTIWIVDAHRGDGKRFIVRADEKLTAFIELELAIRAGNDNHYTSRAAHLTYERGKIAGGLS